MKRMLSLTLSLLMLIACSLGTMTAFAEDGAAATARVDLRDCQVTLQSTRMTYTGKALRPSVTVRHNSQMLEEHRDYTVQYSANTACGTAWVRITGKGDYKGVVNHSFKIVPGRVKGLSTSRTTTTITIKWSKVPGAAVYRVYQSASKNGNYSKVATVTTNNAKISKLSPGKRYYFQVVACGKKDGSYIGALSDTLTTGTRPSTVSVKSVSLSGSSLKVQWSKASGSGYEVRYSTDKNMKKGVKTVKVKKSSTNSIVIKKVKKDTTYYVQVRAFLTFPNKVYNGSYSKVKSTTFSNLYASYSSHYVNNANRTTNLRIASKAINGTVIQPGQTFSFNQVVGKRTSAKGYKNAYVFSGGGTVMGIGGGICQVASTMFNTALLANVSIVERHQHSQRVSYVPLGRDAAIMWGSQDFRWKNNTGKAIKIKMSVQDGTISCKFYTNENVKPAKVSLQVSKSGNKFTLRRSVGGKVNYTARSKY